MTMDMCSHLMRVRVNINHDMNTGPATNNTIKFVCDKCGQLNQIEGSYDPSTYTLRLRYAECKHCGHPRHATTVPSGYFKCITCHVVYKWFKHWQPVADQAPPESESGEKRSARVNDMCSNCYMRSRRKEQKEGGYIRLAAFLTTLIFPMFLFPIFTVDLRVPEPVVHTVGRVDFPGTIFHESYAGPLVGVGDYIYVNLKNMEITLYHDDMSVLKFPVLSIRAIGSKFDTPKGLFKIGTKEQLHFSSIGHVWMPYSMQFSGDFFIHGWPYYPDGTPVPQGYSGGCVRLSDEVAKAVYEFASIGMPVLIE